MMDVLQREAAKSAIKKMMDRGHLDICTIDQILRMTGAIPPKREYDILRTLHCVNFNEMSPKLRIEMPRLMQVVLEAQPMPSPYELLPANCLELDHVKAG